MEKGASAFMEVHVSARLATQLLRCILGIGLLLRMFFGLGTSASLADG